MANGLIDCDVLKNKDPLPSLLESVDDLIEIRKVCRKKFILEILFNLYSFEEYRILEEFRKNKTKTQERKDVFLTNISPEGCFHSNRILLICLYCNENPQ